MSTSADNVRIVQGDLLKSSMHGLVNTVNTVGVMGKGIALAFKKRYPDMFADYVRRCDAKEVHLGQPYPFEVDGHVVINFPTKAHWRSVSKLSDIVDGLEYLKANYRAWGLRSIAVPPLGCGNGQLEWAVVGPILIDHLAQLNIPVELYAPHGVDVAGGQLNLWDDEQRDEPQRKIDPSLIALVEILHRLEDQPYRWPVGRVMLQKLAYFATVAGLPTGFEYERASFGPFSSQLKPAIAKLQNNGLLDERQRGRMFEVRVGDAYEAARKEFTSQIEKWDQVIDSTCDLVARFDTTQAEIAATVHYTAYHLYRRNGDLPTATEVLNAVEAWKVRRVPPLKREDILRAIANLATRQWIRVLPDESIQEAAEELSLI
ncbi:MULTISPECIES: macro domain-containing protein [unclassified Streptomyces]|uniref:type II toxin-antitoxin system antitoxin DNA ADP-ribosyl glycohydrolase DarG n=1 Tax=unclassified Streptomyces TaxID=2593676 RepID=UPI002367162C|nr:MULTISPECIES: macro domain-containing protein [unclassified Streptomyces]MDF3140094.1 macro domain-containing protein [Streptomyces sp. T21Q-yed]WDF40142.1 macro domain-containing protein [Streptomyces sp. T12]